MLHEFVQLVEGGPTIALPTLRRNAEALGDDEGILHRTLVERIFPGWLCDGEHCAQVRQIICHRLWCHLGDQLVCERNDIRAANSEQRLFAISYDLIARRT